METQRIILRPWCDSDASTLFKYPSHPEESPQIIRTPFSTEGMSAVERKETREAIPCVGYHADNPPPHAASPIKQQLIDEVNALGIKEMRSIENLFVMQGSFINIEYTINGNKAKLLNDDATYWCNQVEKSDGRCFGIACDKRFILVSEYGKNGVDAELVLIKKRGI